MRLPRLLLALIVAGVLAVVGFALLAHGKPAVGKVFATDLRGPKITIDGGPQIERPSQFRILVGDSRHKAQWVKVNAAQYASCATGDEWNGTICSKFDLEFTVPAVNLRWMAAGAVLTAAGVITVAVNHGRSDE